MNLKLRSAKIKNFKSLGDLDLNFRNLTILVGSNSSGKSNSLEALRFLSSLLVRESLPAVEGMQRALRYGNDNICYSITVEDDDKQAEYSLSLASNGRKTLLAHENLKVNGKEVINIINGKGEVSDEDGKNTQKYQSAPESIEGLALRSAGNFGNKPFTKKLASYIREWKFYDIDPDIIRQYPSLMGMIKGIAQRSNPSESIPSLDAQAGEVQEVLNYWAQNERDTFEGISQELKDCLNISLSLVEEGEQIVKVLEPDGKQMPLSSMSDGTLRLIAYFILLYQSDIPPLIGIEEPERNLHPGILKDVASIMKRLSKRTQVVFTTHSSQLLDCFDPEEISSEISVILLSKKDDSGTKACLLDKLAENRDDLLDWMNDFGLGSAIYHSHLIEEIVGS
ncbi:AAA family ATPase [Argonema antarcticum]|uniref:AAA family ATPase n=1 Tax=Argonema antarcticum TaxID=2942763 RepID=UPI0020122A23|nr:AAA family ATPase [Argonema antarcticum]MCL1471434.1 AAA family ATPase [Argonema antarcticum A004/B2]